MKKTITEIIPVDIPKAIRKLARERVGQPPAVKVIVEKKRKKAKHPKKEEEQ